MEINLRKTQEELNQEILRDAGRDISRVEIFQGIMNY